MYDFTTDFRNGRKWIVKIISYVYQFTEKRKEKPLTRNFWSNASKIMQEDLMLRKLCKKIQ